MKKFFFIIPLLFPLFAGAEIDAGLTVSGVKDINRTSMGVRGEYYPRLLERGKFSLSCEFGIELVERFVFGLSDYMVDSVDIDDDSVSEYAHYFNKEYRDYMFIPLGITLRYSLGDPEKLRTLNPMISIGVGGVLNVYQTSYRQFQDWYASYNPSTGYLAGYLFSTYVDFGGKSISTFDFFIKPKLTITYNRLYVSYERLFNSRYITGTFSVGYVFKL